MRIVSASVASRGLQRAALMRISASRTTSLMAAAAGSNITSSSTLLQSRSFAKLTPPGNDPLQVLRSECFERNLCDESGFRLPGVHWVFSVAVASDDPNKPPNLRTVGVQRVSEDGIDFVVKKGGGTSNTFKSGRPVAVLHSQGKYVAGQQAEQWRADGYCEKIPLEDILHKLPHYTITSMVASNRVAKEFFEQPEDRVALKDRVHMTDVMQNTRIELENGDISNTELANSICAFRFQPDRIERMVGGPDAVLWDRWEWERSEAGDCPEGKLAWKEPQWLLPH